VEALYTVIVVLHILSWLGALALIDPRGGVIGKGAAHGIATALLTGLILVGLGESVESLDKDYNHVKIGIKLLVAIAATGYAFAQTNKPTPSKAAAILFGLVGLNILLAIVW
jgi:hypothetical protein